MPAAPQTLARAPNRPPTDRQPIASIPRSTQSPSAIILGLSPTTNYTAEVRATRPRGMFASQPAVLFFRATAAAAGPAATGPAAPATAATKGATGAAGTTVGPDGWACTPREGYPACSAGQAGLCVPASCADMVRLELIPGERCRACRDRSPELTLFASLPPLAQARLGRCASTNLRVADWAARAVTQHCASECGGCAAATPVLGGRPADRIAPPHDFCCAYGEGQYFRTADRYAVSDAAADF